MGGCQYILQEVNIKSNMDYLSDVIVCCRELSSEKTTERKVKIQMTLLKLEGYFFSTLHMHILTYQKVDHNQSPGLALLSMLPSVCFRSARVDPELTLSRPRLTQCRHREQTLVSEADPESERGVWSN